MSTLKVLTAKRDGCGGKLFTLVQWDNSDQVYPFSAAGKDKILSVLRSEKRRDLIKTLIAGQFVPAQRAEFYDLVPVAEFYISDVVIATLEAEHHEHH